MIKVRLEKVEAKYLEPGDFFVTDPEQDADWFTIQMNTELGITGIVLRTNLPAHDVEDGDNIVYRLRVERLDAPFEEPAEMSPFSAPGSRRKL